ncbi:MAG: GNAT family N-acetyltransferase [Thermoanaerobaculia bacterium]|jgi:8-oxo-dGTP diphosphatase
MNADQLDALVRDLREDAPRNTSIINFIERNEILGVYREGRSARVQGRSDHVWNYFSSESEGELRALADQLGDGDDHFAALEDWMLPIVCRGRELSWCLRMMKFVLPASVELPVTVAGEIGALSVADAEHIYENSNYQQYISVDYTRDCIRGGPTVAIREDGLLVAWAMTQDDGAMGFLHVLEPYRSRGFGRRLTIALSSKLREKGQLPFAYVAEDNGNSIALLTSLGFVPDRAVQWVELK